MWLSFRGVSFSALHPDDPADGTAIQILRLQGGGGGI